MGRKKQQRNEFYYFMVDKKPEIEKRLGRIVTMAELPQHLSSEWKTLSEAQKQKYKLMVVKRKETAEKLDCRGLPMTELRRQEEMKRKKIEEMEREILNTVDMYASGSILHEATFYIISTSYYVLTEEGKYSPAELGLVQFSFRNGIFRHYHAILKPEIPKSYGYTAKVHSETTHKLLEENSCAVEDKEAVFVGLKEFVYKENNKLPPLYTLDDEIEQTTAILDDITGAGYYRVYSLGKLFMNLYSRIHPKCPITLSIANNMMTHCGLDYHPEAACEWHKNYQKDAGKYCSLSCARRWLFLMCDNVNLEKEFGIQPQEGRHQLRAVQSCGVPVDVQRTVHKNEVARSPSQMRAKSAWHNVDDTAGSIIDPPGSSFSASCAASLASQNRDEESEEFPSLTGGITLRGAGRVAVPQRGAGAGRLAGSADPLSNGTLLPLAGIGRGMKPEDIELMKVPGLGRGQKTQQPK